MDVDSGMEKASGFSSIKRVWLSKVGVVFMLGLLVTPRFKILRTGLFHELLWGGRLRVWGGRFPPAPETLAVAMSVELNPSRMSPSRYKTTKAFSALV